MANRLPPSRRPERQQPRPDVDYAEMERFIVPCEPSIIESHDQGLGRGEIIVSLILTGQAFEGSFAQFARLLTADLGPPPGGHNGYWCLHLSKEALACVMAKAHLPADVRPNLEEGIAEAARIDDVPVVFVFLREEVGLFYWRKRHLEN